MGSLKKSFFWLLKAFVAAFIPLGTFIFDRELKKEEASLASWTTAGTFSGC